MSKKVYRALLAFATLALLLALLGSIFTGKILVLSAQNSDEKLLLPLRDSDSFTLEFLHSIEKTPVLDYFIIADNNHLLLVSTEYYSQGVGLPFSLEEGELINEDGVFKLDLDREFENIHLGIVPLAQQQLHLNGDTYYLSDYFAGGVVKLEVKNHRFWQFWLH